MRSGELEGSSTLASLRTSEGQRKHTRHATESSPVSPCRLNLQKCSYGKDPVDGIDARSLCDGFTRTKLVHCNASGVGIHAISRDRIRSKPRPPGGKKQSVRDDGMVSNITFRLPIR